MISIKSSRVCLIQDYCLLYRKINTLQDHNAWVVERLVLGIPANQLLTPQKPGCSVAYTIVIDTCARNATDCSTSNPVNSYTRNNNKVLTSSTVAHGNIKHPSLCGWLWTTTVTIFSHNISTSQFMLTLWTVFKMSLQLVRAAKLVCCSPLLHLFMLETLML